MRTLQLALLTLLCVFSSSLATGQVPVELRARLERADLETARLSPFAFENIPGPVQATLNRLGCLIPQPWVATDPSNVISGEFMQAGRMQWAALCSRERSSAILVLDPDGQVRAELEERGDDSYLQDTGNDSITFSRQLTAVQRDFIVSRSGLYGSSDPPPILHQGINDAFVGKASTVRYYYDGEWLALPGND